MDSIIMFLEYIASAFFWVMLVWIIVDKIRKHKVPKKHMMWFLSSIGAIVVMVGIGMATGVDISNDSNSSSSSSSSKVSSSAKESSSSEKKSSSSSSSKESHSESTTDKWNSWLKTNLVDSGQAVGATAQKNGNNYIINVKGYDEWMNENDDSLSQQLDFIRQRIIGNFDKFQGNSPRVNIYSQGKLIAYTSANDSQSLLHWRNKEQRKELGWIK